MRKFNLFLLALVLLIGVPYYWLLLDNRPGTAQAKPVSISQLEQLAASIPGPAPSRVEVGLVGFTLAPGNFAVAGIGMKRRLIGTMAFRLPVAGRGPVMIDSGLSQSAADCLGMTRYMADVQGQIDKALESADVILLTHEHADHMGGIASLAGSASGGVLLTRIRLNDGQTQRSDSLCYVPWPSGVAIKPSLVPGRASAVAPGVVVIPAPSHTPGSQIIFVRLADGREYLFAGDIATMNDSWTELRARSRLIGQYIFPEKRTEVFSWLLTIRKLKAENPALVVVPGHDYEWLTDPKNKTRVMQMQ